MERIQILITEIIFIGFVYYVTYIKIQIECIIYEQSFIFNLHRDTALAFFFVLKI